MSNEHSTSRHSLSRQQRSAAAGRCCCPAQPLSFQVHYVLSVCCYICVLILVCMCPHTGVYVSSYWCIRVLICVLIVVYMCADSRVCVLANSFALTLHTSAYVSIRQHTSAYVLANSFASHFAYVSIRQHTSVYVSIRQHTC